MGAIKPRRVFRVTLEIESEDLTVAELKKADYLSGPSWSVKFGRDWRGWAHWCRQVDVARVEAPKAVGRIARGAK